jgi:hypothetical protein
MPTRASPYVDGCPAWTFDETMTVLCIDEDSLKHAIASGELKVSMYQGRMMFLAEDVEVYRLAWMAQRDKDKQTHG